MSRDQIMTAIENAAPYKRAVPDMGVLQDSPMSPPAFPVGVLRSAGEWIEEIADGTCTPADYSACALLATVSSLIGNSRWASPRPKWAEPPVLWIGLLGKSSSRKSSALSHITRPLRVIEDDLLEEHLSAVRDWEGKCAMAEEKLATWRTEVKEAAAQGYPEPTKPECAEQPPEPLRPRLFVSDVTVEALAPILSGQPRGVLVERDELSGWIQSFGAYKGGGGADRAFWLEAYGGRSFTVDRVKNGGKPVCIPCLSVSVCGTIQPDKLQEVLLQGANDGFAARILWTWPDRLPPREVTRIGSNASNDKAEKAYRWLRSLPEDTDERGHFIPRNVRFSDEAERLLFEVEREVYALTEHEDGPFEAHVGKFAGFTIRLALTLEFLWAAFGDQREPQEVSADAVRSAAGLLFEYFKPMAERSYMTAALPKVERGATEIAKHIRKNDLRVLNERDLKRKAGLKHARTNDEVTEALELLEQAGWITQAERTGEFRKPRKDWTVNPEVLK